MIYRTDSLFGILGVAMAVGLSAVGEAQAHFERPAIHAPSSAMLLASARVIRRTTITVETLPKDCVRTKISNAVVWRCGKTYYEADGTRYVVVYIE